MFGKLLKYDFRAMWKQFALIWPAALLLAFVNRFTLSGLESSSGVGETAAGVAMLVYVAILMAMFIIAVIFVIQRFYKGLLGDEGYLMHTLPVKPWQLIGSKLLCAVVVTFLNVAIAILSVLLLVPWPREAVREILGQLGYIFSHWSIHSTEGVLGVIEFILFMLVSFATGYLQLYLAMSIGHLANKNRVAVSVVAFIAINVVMNVLMNAVLPVVDDQLSPMMNGLGGMAGFHAAMWLAIVVELILCAAYFVGTEYILRKKLNLE